MSTRKSPPRRIAFFLRALLLTGVIPTLIGCGGTHNPSRIGNLPNGPIIQTHAKPPLLGYYNNFDPAAKTITVTPKVSIGQVGTQHVIVASVCDDDGNGRRSRRVEWHVSGAGHIVEVDESGVFPGRGYMVDDKYAVSYTNYKKHTLTRGNKDERDDVELRPGQTFLVIYSPEEGETQVTAYAPGIYDWQRHKVTVTKYWVDAQPVFPPPAVNRTGEPHTLVTRVMRSSDGTGAQGYRVRYRILDGPPAAFDGAGPAAEVVTDNTGNGSIIMRQVAPAQGTNRIQIDVVRPPSTPTGRELLISSYVTTKTWVSPQISIQKMGPSQAAVGGQIPYKIIVTNTGNIATQGLSIRDGIPPGVNVLGTSPQAMLQGNNVVWNFGPLQPGQSVPVDIVLQVSQDGTLINEAEAGTPEGLFQKASTTTQIVKGSLIVTKNGPPSAVLGQDVRFDITVTNNGPAPVSNVQLRDTTEGGLASVNGETDFVLNVGTIEPGGSRAVPIVLRAVNAGRACNRVVAQGDGGISATAEHCLEISQPQLSITKTGPAIAFVGTDVTFDITVRNTGSIPAQEVTIRDPLPAELQLLEAVSGAIQGQNALWNIGTLNPNEERTVRLRARAAAFGEKVCNSAVVSAVGINEQQSPPACLSINGVPGVRSEIIDRMDPVPLGGETTYDIKVLNQGSRPLTNLVVTCDLPPELDYVDARGAESTLPPTYDAARRKLTFKPLLGLPEGKGLPPGGWVYYQVQVKAVKPGDARFLMSITADELRAPVRKEESTQCFNPQTGEGSVDRSAPRSIIPAGEQPLAPAGGIVDPETNVELKPIIIPGQGVEPKPVGVPEPEGLIEPDPTGLDDPKDDAPAIDPRIADLG